MKRRLNLCLLINHPRLIDRTFIKKLSALGRLKFLPGFNKLPLQQQVAVLKDSDIAIIGWGPCMLPLSLLSTDYCLKYICHMTGEMKRYLPLEYIKAGIKVTNWGSSLSFATAEGTVALLLAVMKNIIHLDKTTRKSGRAEWHSRPFQTLMNVHLGIYGLGPIGKITARLLKPFCPRLSFYDPTIKRRPAGLKQYRSLRALFSNNDIVTVHAGLNNKTRTSITYKELSLLPKGGIFINTARGPIVNEKDLARILKTGRIYAGIEVIDNENDWRTSPLINAPNVVFSGHVISRTGHMEKRILQQTAIDNIKAFISNRPLKYRITPKKYRMMT
jgi:phosphoglycerate dehydrogenase-like enzyme